MFRHRILAFRNTWPRLPFAHNGQSCRHSSTSKANSLDRITSKLPRRLQKYTSGLRNAPVSHIISFLILHEITAIVPLFALFGVFHYTDYVPLSYVTTHFGDYVQKGVTRFERYFSRKGWFGFTTEEFEAGTASRQADDSHKDRATEAVERWQSGEQKYRIVVEVALAYAITKALLPIRIIGSVWATPWFAGVLARLRSSLTSKS